jgi:cytochrome P450
MTTPRPFHDIPLVTFPPDYDLRVGPVLAGFYEQHGPIFRTSEVDDVVYLVGPEANRFVLSTNRQAFSHHKGWGWRFGVLQLFGNGLLTMDGDEHNQHRKMMNPAFVTSYMDRYLPIMNRIVRERTQEWAALGEVDVYDEARTITFNVAAEALAGLQPGDEVDRFRELYFQLLTLGGVALDYDDYQQQLARLHNELHALLIPKIQERRARPTDDVLGLLVQARDEQGHALSDEQLIAHTNILLVAGHETSTSLGAWLLYLLSRHPDYTQRVLQEQAAVLGDRLDPTLADVRQMKMLDNALSEAERMYPPVPNGPRGVVEDFVFNGYHVPAGIYAFYSIAASHLIPSIFAEPERFDPDRFAPPREEDRKTPYALVGFGGGPRICIGINFAQVEIKVMASHILRRYRIEPTPGQQIVQAYGATGGPLNGIRMQVAERQAIPAR